MESDRSVRYRLRAQSVNRAEDIVVLERKERSKQPDKPIHGPNDSLLSSTSGYDNYRGFLNLCIILLALSNGRVALENVLKYGNLIDPIQWINVLIRDPTSWPTFSLLTLSHLFILTGYGLEIALSKRRIAEKRALLLHIVNLVFVIVFPAAVVLLAKVQPVGASLCALIYTIIFMKMVSYIQVNKWCRMAQSSGNYNRQRSYSQSASAMVNGGTKSSLVKYPDNLNLKDLYYFMFVPTLCYELNFPRSARIRKNFLLRRTIEMVFLFQLMLGLLQQWIVPTVKNSRIPFKEMNYSRMLERLLKLAVPNHFIWLIFFYWYFHSFMNLVAELTRFADRQFYRDWWNAESVQYFWQNWNIPVHRWCVRHLYLPLIKMGYNRQLASIAVFFGSAFFHEYLVSVPLHMFRVWSFTGMVLQIPFARFVNRYLHGRQGNMAVWLSLIIGQPLSILMYYHDYYVTNFDVQSSLPDISQGSGGQ